jgi:hypothetical protein
MHKTHFKLKTKKELKAGNQPIILKGWPEFFVIVFILTFVIQLLLLILMNWKS